MDPLYGKGAVLLGSIVMIAIRAPHGQRSRGIRVVKSRRGRLETLLLTFAMVGFFLPLVWVFSPWLSAADYPLSPVPFASGVLCLALGLWIFHRSHADLGTNWSVTLEVRENHTLVTGGVYARVRHPMYTGLLLHSVGQALVLPNWIAGPAYLVPMALIIACRLGPEERMMEEEFGGAYAAYRARSWRLVPGLF